MDPNATLSDIRELCQEWHNMNLDAEGAADQFVSLFEALDSWISKGGFMPIDWGQ